MIKFKELHLKNQKYFLFFLIARIAKIFEGLLGSQSEFVAN